MTYIISSIGNGEDDIMPEEKKIRPQDKWNEKAGLISKSYKLKREVVEEYAKACNEAGVSQAGQLTKMMKEFCASVKK